jgi:hypothetical protein
MRSPNPEASAMTVRGIQTMARKGTAFAKNTPVTIDRTLTNIQGELIRFGAERVQFFDDPARHRKVFRFEMYDAKVRKPGWYPFSFGIPLVGGDQQKKEIMRGALLMIKGICVGIDYGIASPAEAFHAFIVTDITTGETMIETAQNLLPSPRPEPELPHDHR